jgi:hypothetical protein
MKKNLAGEQVQSADLKSCFSAIDFVEEFELKLVCFIRNKNKNAEFICRRVS